jgi:hypothetical protein
VIGSDDIAVTGDSDIVVITAGAKQKPGQTRLELAAVNVAMCRSLVPALLELSPDAILLLVTNPVDIVTYAAVQASGLPSRRVFGSGTVLDSSVCGRCSPSTATSPCTRERVHRRRARRLAGRRLEPGRDRRCAGAGMVRGGTAAA